MSTPPEPLDLAALTDCRNALVGDASELIAIIEPHLGTTQRAAIGAIAGNGGAVAVEVALDGSRNVVVSITTVGRDGSRHVLAHVEAQGDGSSH
ncbi:MAG: hypothetical protein ABI601_18610 [bacterium]